MQFGFDAKENIVHNLDQEKYAIKTAIKPNMFCFMLQISNTTQYASSL